MERELLHEHVTDSGLALTVVRGDLTRENVDAIVNPANERLVHGGGVAGAIVRRGGVEIQRESDRWVLNHGPVPTGGATITHGGVLAARYVIHAVGPVWQGRGDEDGLLAGAVRSALELAAEHQLKSVALPAISSGIFGFPKERAARVILDAVDAFLAANPAGPVGRVVVCNIDEPTCAVFAAEARRRYG